MALAGACVDGLWFLLAVDEILMGASGYLLLVVVGWCELSRVSILSFIVNGIIAWRFFVGNREFMNKCCNLFVGLPPSRCN